uniref:Uncharacterized protein n=1 Tax=Peronospora matthiolae TaxID=2874970 RepID=A0AAV1TFI4_9STRA
MRHLQARMGVNSVFVPLSYTSESDTLVFSSRSDAFKVDVTWRFVTNAEDITVESRSCSLESDRDIPNITALTSVIAITNTLFVA